MSIPDYAALMLPMLRRAAKAQNGVPAREITQALAAEIDRGAGGVFISGNAP